MLASTDGLRWKLNKQARSQCFLVPEGAHSAMAPRRQLQGSVGLQARLQPGR